MGSTADVFIGITSWNSELFLPHCLRAVQRSTGSLNTQVVVLDNCSTDRSAAIAAEHGAEVVVHQCTQADALNALLRRSRAPYVLLLHADVVLLSERWFELCAGRANDGAAIVSPEDIGCGPYSRPFGIGKPESSFLFFSARDLPRIRQWRWRKWHRVPLPRFEVDFYGDHITHNLPARLRAQGLRWHAMDVHVSGTAPEPIYVPSFRPTVWSEELGYLRYGLGNFYSLDGVITHYHNWYERVDREVDPASIRTTGADGKGFPLAYISAYTNAFLRDYASDALVLPPATKSNRSPKAL